MASDIVTGTRAAGFRYLITFAVAGMGTHGLLQSVLH